jgi:hypothetical protein
MTVSKTKYSSSKESFMKGLLLAIPVSGILWIAILQLIF